MTLNGASKCIDDMRRRLAPPAQVRLIDDTDLPTGWAWLAWGEMKIKPIIRALWEGL